MRPWQRKNAMGANFSPYFTFTGAVLIMAQLQNLPKRTLVKSLRCFKVLVSFIPPPCSFQVGQETMLCWLIHHFQQILIHTQPLCIFTFLSILQCSSPFLSSYLLFLLTPTSPIKRLSPVWGPRLHLYLPFTRSFSPPLCESSPNPHCLAGSQSAHLCFFLLPIVTCVLREKKNTRLHTTVKVVFLP